MKRLHCLSIFFAFLLNLLAMDGYAQTTTTFSYNNIPSLAASICFFNIPPGPSAPITIGGYNHYGIVGGVDYTGTEFVLSADNTGGGTGFGIYFGFDQNHKYTIRVRALASSSSMVFLWATNQYRQGIPSSCNPGFPNIITQSANTTSSITNLTQSYADYTLITDYTPTSANINYLLMSAYNTVGALGAVQIESVTIIATPLCNPPTMVSRTPIGNNQVQIEFIPPSFNAPVVNYDVALTRFVYVGTIIPVPVAVGYQPIPGVGTNSPVVVTASVSGLYSVTIRSSCSTGEVSQYVTLPNFITVN